MLAQIAGQGCRRPARGGAEHDDVRFCRAHVVQADLVRVLAEQQRYSVEVRRADGRPLVVDDGELRVHVAAAHPGRSARRQGRLVRPQREHLDPGAFGGGQSGEQPGHVGRMPERVQRDVDLAVGEEDDLELRVGLHRADQGVGDFTTGEVLVLQVDVSLGVGDGADVGLEDGHLALRAGREEATAPERPGQLRRRSAGDRGRRRLRRQVGCAGRLGLVPMQSESRLDIGNHRATQPHAHVMGRDLDRLRAAVLAVPGVVQ
jgi:hypothetical protein